MARRAHLFAAASVLVACLALTLPVVASATGSAGHIDMTSELPLAQQFGYTPDYTQHVPTFDPDNVPAIRSRSANQHETAFVHRLEHGTWVRHDFLAALRAAYPDFAGTVSSGGWSSDRVDFDAQGRAYTVLTIRLEEGAYRNVLLASTDGCATWTVVELPFGDDTPQIDEIDWGNVAAEHDTGRLLQGPPLLAIWRQTGPWKGEWASRNELYVVQPRWQGSTLTLQPPVLVRRDYLGVLQCAGGASFAVTDGDQSFFVYSTTVPLSQNTSPTWSATYDHLTNTVGPSILVCTSRPGNDSHNSPGICMDGAGILHVVSGSHNWSFYYARSLVPRSTTAWTFSTPVLSSGYRTSATDPGGRGSQTYVSLVCGPDGVLHVVSRQARRATDSHFGGVAYAALVHQAFRPGQGWSTPDLIVVPPATGYSLYYHKLTMDRLGRLFVSCSYFSQRDPPATRQNRRFHHRMVLISEDGGSTWRFATTADFGAGVSALRKLKAAASGEPASAEP